MVAPTESYGKQTLSTDAVVASLNGRPVAGLDVRGGASASRTASDSCAVREAVPESALHDPFCRVSSGYLVQFRGLATYAFAASGIHVGAVYQNKPGPVLSGIRFISNAAIIGSLGRPLAGNVAAIPVNVIEPGTQYGERIDQLDVRVSKVFRIGRREGRIGLDIFNALNGASPLAYSSTLFFSEPLPTSVITPRLFRIAGSFDF